MRLSLHKLIKDTWPLPQRLVEPGQGGRYALSGGQLTRCLGAWRQSGHGVVSHALVGIIVTGF